MGVEVKLLVAREILGEDTGVGLKGDAVSIYRLWGDYEADATKI